MSYTPFCYALSSLSISNCPHRAGSSSGDQWFHPYGEAVMIDEPFYRRSLASGDQWFHPYGEAVMIDETIITNSLLVIHLILHTTK